MSARATAWALVAAAALGAAWLGRGFEKPALAAGSAARWAAPEKRAAADALNAAVTIPGFRADVHAVTAGESLWAIARAQHVDLATLCALNPGLGNLDVRPGQALLVANERGDLHQVAPGENVASVAQLYGVDPATLSRANSIGLWGLSPGQLLFVPGARPHGLNPRLAAAYRRRGLFTYPLQGPLSSRMGERTDPFTGEVTLHNGIDIKGSYNEAVGAAAAGTVVVAGWNGGFGKCVEIDHHNGFVTLYGHLNVVKVQLGQRVRQSQCVGLVGASGRATGPHLHFTIYRHGRAVNPLPFLR